MATSANCPAPNIPRHPYVSHFRLCLYISLSADPALFRALLSFPNSDDVSEEEPGKDLSKIPHIERLCSYLSDTSRQDADVCAECLISMSLPHFT